MQHMQRVRISVDSLRSSVRNHCQRRTDLFEDKFVRQGHDEDRSIEDSLSIAWDLIATLDADQITRISRKYIEKYLPKKE